MTSTGFSVDSSEKKSFTTLYTSGAFSRDGEIVGPKGSRAPERKCFSVNI